MSDTLEIVNDRTFPRQGHLVVAPRYYGRLNGTAMNLAEAVRRYRENGDNAPLVLPPELESASIFQEDAYVHTSPRNHAGTAPERPCAYCGTLSTGCRCESCGAPRREEKESRELYRAWQNLARFPECLHPEVI